MLKTHTHRLIHPHRGGFLLRFNSPLGRTNVNIHAKVFPHLDEAIVARDAIEADVGSSPLDNLTRIRRYNESILRRGYRPLPLWVRFNPTDGTYYAQSRGIDASCGPYATADEAFEAMLDRRHRAAVNAPSRNNGWVRTELPGVERGLSGTWRAVLYCGYDRGSMVLLGQYDTEREAGRIWKETCKRLAAMHPLTVPYQLAAWDALQTVPGHSPDVLPRYVHHEGGRYFSRVTLRKPTRRYGPFGPFTCPREAFLAAWPHFVANKAKRWNESRLWEQRRRRAKAKAAARE